MSGGAGRYVVLVGDSVTLVCATSLFANPSPVIKWSDNNQQVITTVGRYNDDGAGVSLSIADVQANDNGVWSCSLTVSYENALTVHNNGSLVPAANSLIGNQVINISLIVVGKYYNNN